MMRKWILLSVLATGLLPLQMAAQDDLYFNPNDEAEKTPVKECRSDNSCTRNVDEYNRRVADNSVKKIGQDSLGNDIIRVKVGDTFRIDTIYPGVADSYYNDDDDFRFTRSMGRYDGYYGWYSPFFYGYNGPWRGYWNGFYGNWYDWYDWGLYYPGYYGYYNFWGDPYYSYYAGWGPRYGWYYWDRPFYPGGGGPVHTGTGGHHYGGGNSGNGGGTHFANGNPTNRGAGYRNFGNRGTRVNAGTFGSRTQTADTRGGFRGAQTFGGSTPRSNGGFRDSGTRTTSTTSSTTYSGSRFSNSSAGTSGSSFSGSRSSGGSFGGGHSFSGGGGHSFGGGGGAVRSADRKSVV